MRIRYVSPTIYAIVTLALAPNTQRLMVINPTTLTILASYTYS